ncbi:MAG: BrnT family toxin [Synergistaceae bacterium]|nr:BrnT family toxin [Synergistaceae bacterium]
MSRIRILFVVFIERVRDDNPEGHVYRIISARDATKKEAKIYERGLSR